VSVAEPYDELREAFKSVAVALRRVRGRDTHRPGELSLAQYGLLYALSGNGERSSREIGEDAALSPATVTQMLESLEAHGLVARTRSADDKRVVLTELTEHGRALLDKRKREMEPHWQSAVAGFSDEELQVSAAVMRRLAGYLDRID
jgi:DNA-binding MarR family transcriptional regulator